MQVYSPFRRFAGRLSLHHVALTSLAAVAVVACANGVDPAVPVDDPVEPTATVDAGRAVDAGGTKTGADASKTQEGPPVDPPKDPPDAGADTSVTPPVVDSGTTPPIVDSGTAPPVVVDAGVDTGTVTPPPTGAACVLISEYLESSSTKALEIWNCGSAPLALDSYILCLESNAATTCTTHLPLSGTLAAGKTYVVCAATFGTACSTTSAVVNFNGNDRIALFRDTNGNGTVERGTDVVVDSIGELGALPPSGVSPSATSPWEETDLRRATCAPFAGTATFTTASFYTAASSTSLTNLGVAPALSCP